MLVNPIEDIPCINRLFEDPSLLLKAEGLGYERIYRLEVE
jgi:hypothetical protein